MRETDPVLRRADASDRGDRRILACQGWALDAQYSSTLKTITARAVPFFTACRPRAVRSRFNLGKFKAAKGPAPPSAASAAPGPARGGDSGEAERLFRKESERHSGIIPNTIGA